MWRKHKKELIGCTLSAVGIILLVLFLVWLFEIMGLHVPGTREMWIGLIGAVIGGAFTLFGVLITIFQQEESQDKQRRIENMPILGFEVRDGNDDIEFFITYTEEGLITSGFPNFEKKCTQCIIIKIANGLAAFNFTIEGCAINGKEVPLASEFNPAQRRLVTGESIIGLFDYTELLNTNIFCIIRFSYEDIFGNKYYQDLPFIYDELSSQSQQSVCSMKQIIEIRDIRQPILACDAVSIEESAKEYIDYEVFLSKKQNFYL